MEFITLLLFGIFFIIYPVVNPDYVAYSVIYSTADLGGDWEVFYIYLNHFFREAGFTYDQFRLFILLFSLTGLWLLLLKLKPPLKAKSFFSAYSLIMVISLAVFVLEYFVIRIRAGLSIGILMWALYFFNSKYSYKKFIGLVMLMLAYFTHQLTVSVLSIFIFTPWLFAVYGKNSKLKNIIYFAILFFLTFVCLYYLNDTYAQRGEKLFSQLNPIRLLSLSFIPIVIYFMSAKESELSPQVSSGLYMFPKLFSQLYIFFALGLAVMWLCGLTNESGEAIVRVFTLFSFPAIIALKLKGLFFNAKIPSYILLSNALFFIYALVGGTS
jgi:hypothetical protein